jgi:hypothetical protein
MFIKVLLSLLAFLFVQFVALNQSKAADSQVYETVSLEKLVSLLNSNGYQASLSDTGKSVVWMIEGRRNTLTVGQKSLYILFYCGVNAKGEVTIQTVNNWNKTKQFSRSYLDDEGDPILELDLDLTGGVTEARILDFFKTCRTSQLRWYNEVIHASDN